MSDFYAQDASDAAAATEAINEQTANFQYWIEKRPSMEGVAAKVKASGSFDPYTLIKCPHCGTKNSPLDRRCVKCDR